MKDEIELEYERINDLERQGKLHPFTIACLRRTVHERLKHPCYQHPVSR